MSDDLLDAYEFPEAFDLDAAEHMTRVEAADGTEFCVLVDALTGQHHLVHADVVEYDGVLDHPMTTGAIGFVWVLGALLAPAAASAYLALAVSGPWWAGAAVLAGGIAGWLLARVALYRTFLGDWLFRFLEWNDHRNIIVAGRGSV